MPTMKITNEFLKQNRFKSISNHNGSPVKGFVRANESIELMVILNDASIEPCVFLNSVYLPDIDAIKLNQIWILLTSRKENWFNYTLPCSICGDLPDKYNESTYRSDDTVKYIIKCRNCSTKVLGVTDEVSVMTWNLSMMGVFNDEY